jgi:TonB-dependent receptor
MFSQYRNRAEKQRKAFKYSLLATAIMSVGSIPAYAQEQDAEGTEETEVIEVKGVRGDLLNAQNLKREGDTFLDAISASDIGVLPDRSVLEAISRVPGVSIGRFAAPNDPDHFGTEGSGVAIRGLTHVRSEFNGRDTFTANEGRGLSFEDVPPELMGSVEVFKNQTADMIEGGIAGTVNLNTRKPFDSDGRIISISADATYADFIEETTPTFSALFSDTWQTDAGGRLGFLINYSHSELKAQSDGTQVGLYELQDRLVDGSPVVVPRTARLTRKQDDRTREGLAAVLQWENTDGSIQATGEYIRSDSQLAWAERAIEMDDGGVNAFLVSPDGTEFEFDEQGIFEKGVISSDAGWRGNAPERQPGGIFGAQHTLVTRSRNAEALVEDFSFNLKYTPNDSIGINFDIQYVDAETDILDFSLMNATRAVVGMDLTGSGIPKVDFYDPSFSGDTSHFTNPSNTFFRSAMDHVSDNEGTEFATKLDVNYIFDEGFFSSMRVGVRYADRDQTTRQSDYNWGNISEAWAGGVAGGNAWLDMDENANIPYDTVTLDNFGRGGVLTVDGGPTFLFPSLGLAQDYRNISSVIAPLNPAWTPLNARGGAEGDFVPNEINRTQEQNTALYIRGSFEGELDNGMDYVGNLGLRYVKIENTTDGFISFPDNIPVNAVDPDTGEPIIDADSFLPADQAAFGNGASIALASDSEYTNVLPSFNLKINLSDELIMRFGFSEAIAKPDLGNLRNFVNISADDGVFTYDPNTPDGEEPVPIGYEYSRYTASSGNPELKPMESYNYDLSLEWYFAEGVGSLTGSLFYKDLTNYFVNGTQAREYTNNGATQIVDVQGAINAGDGKIQGFEIAYQQFFDFLPEGWDGLGVQFNYTYIDEEGSPNSGLSPDAPSGDADVAPPAFTGLPLEGLSQDNLNLVVYYEKYGVNARLAYNWRSEYLLTTRDVITTLPIYNESTGFLDGSIFYDVDENWKVGVQATNLLDTETETSMQINQEGDQRTRGVFVSDRRISFIVRANF